MSCFVVEQRCTEQPITGHEREYFDFFFDAIAATPDAVGRAAREAYVDASWRPDALCAGFDWHRASTSNRSARRDLARALRPAVVGTVSIVAQRSTRKGAHPLSDP